MALLACVCAAACRFLKNWSAPRDEVLKVGRDGFWNVVKYRVENMRTVWSCSSATDAEFKIAVQEVHHVHVCKGD